MAQEFFNTELNKLETDANLQFTCPHHGTKIFNYSFSQIEVNSKKTHGLLVNSEVSITFGHIHIEKEDGTTSSRKVVFVQRHSQLSEDKTGENFKGQVY